MKRLASPLSQIIKKGMFEIANLKDKENKEELLTFKDKVLDDFKQLLEDLCDTNHKKSALISYWLNDYKRYLSSEDKFSPKNLVKYKRGTIVKVNLGFNLGNEQGGLHYCVVLNKNDTVNIPILNVVPLSSLKDKHKSIHYTNVNLGNEIYSKTKLKLDQKIEFLEADLTIIKSLQDILENIIKITSKSAPISNKNLLCVYSSLKDPVEEFNNIVNNLHVKPNFEPILDADSNIDSTAFLSKLSRYTEVTGHLATNASKQLPLLKKLLKEIMGMKEGSIAHVDQITTISKMRIYNPKSSYDTLHDVRLSNESLTLIDNKIKELFTY